MTNAELFATIRAKIERRINKLDKDKHINIDAKACRVSELSFLKRFLDTLSEEPDKSLEEAAGEYASDSTGFIDMTAYNAFKAGWKCRDDQMPMPEDTVLFQKGVQEGRRLEREDMLKDAEECELYWDGDFLAIDLNMVALGYSERDKVRIVVLKEEAQQ